MTPRAISFDPYAWRASARVAALPAAARAGYFDILLALYLEADGTLPDDDATLRASARLTADEWAAHAAAIRALLQPAAGAPGRLTHDRVQSILAAERAAAEHRERISETRRRAANTRHQRTAKPASKPLTSVAETPAEDANAMQMHSICNANALQMQGEHEANKSAENRPESACSEPPTPSLKERVTDNPLLYPPKPPFFSPLGLGFPPDRPAAAPPAGDARRGVFAAGSVPTPPPPGPSAPGALENAWLWFDDLVNLWPNGAARGRARIWWQNAIACEPNFAGLAQAILVAARRVAAANLTPEEAAFVPNLHNFLADQRWLDDWPAEIDRIRHRGAAGRRPAPETPEQRAERIGLQIIARRQQA